MCLGLTATVFRDRAQDRRPGAGVGPRVRSDTSFNSLAAAEAETKNVRRYGRAVTSNSKVDVSGGSAALSRCGTRGPQTAPPRDFPPERQFRCRRAAPYRPEIPDLRAFEETAAQPVGNAAHRCREEATPVPLLSISVSPTGVRG